MALACLATSAICLALRVDWYSGADAVSKPAPTHAWENGDHFVWTKRFELREDEPQESSHVLQDLAAGSTQNGEAKLSHTQSPVLEMNISQFKAFSGPVDIHVRMLVHAASAPSWGTCPDYYMGPRAIAAVPPPRDPRLAAPTEPVLGKRVDSRSYFVPWEDNRPGLKKKHKSEAQQLKAQKAHEVQEATDIDELVKLLVKIDSVDDADAKRLSTLRNPNDSVSFGHDFSGLEGNSALEEVDRPLLSKQEKQEAGSMDDFVKFLHSQGTLRACDSALNDIDSSEVEIDQSGTEIPSIESALEETAHSDSTASATLTVEQESIRPFQTENPSPAVPVEEPAVAAPLPNLPRFDPRIFVPNFSVRIEGQAASESDQLSRPQFIPWASPFLVGPRPPAANTTPCVSRKTRVQRWQDKRKQRSKARPADSYVSEVRRAGAAVKPRVNGRFISTGARFVSVTSLQQ